MSLTVGSRTHVGCVRRDNEDALIAEGGVYLVADGMGGHAAGEVASGIVVEAFRELVDRHDVHPDEVRQRLEVANRRIRASVMEDASRAGMGTTASGVVQVQSGGAAHWAVVNIGDSRVYRVIGSTLRRITVDHSEVQELQDAGLITADEARTHPRRNVVTRSIGGHDLPMVDLWVLPLSVGERFLVCSDGLTNELTDAELAALLTGGDDPQRIADELVERALAAGGRDNISVIVLMSDASDGRGPGVDVDPGVTAVELLASPDRADEVPDEHPTDVTQGKGASVEGPKVLAITCPAGHLSPPHRDTCRVCSHQVADQQAFEAARPVLGVLRLESGDKLPLDRGVLLGRSPKVRADLEVAREPHIVKLTSPDNDLSRNHLEIIIDGWHVLACDLGSTNGTTVQIPGSAPIRLRPGEHVALEPGTVLVLADVVSVTFEVGP